MERRHLTQTGDRHYLSGATVDCERHTHWQVFCCSCLDEKELMAWGAKRPRSEPKGSPASASWCVVVVNFAHVARSL